jgi:hypothetical protein
MTAAEDGYAESGFGDQHRGELASAVLIGADT